MSYRYRLLLIEENAVKVHKDYVKLLKREVTSKFVSSFWT